MKRSGIVYHNSWLNFNRLLRLGNLLVFAGLLSLLPPQNAYSIRAMTETFEPPKVLPAPTPAPVPVKINSILPPDITASGAAVIDVPSSVALYEKNPDQRLLPASTTKIMTALVALSDYKLNEEVKIKTAATEGQVMGLKSDEIITVENLLYGILVHSANDAAYALAEHHPQGIGGFTNQMNEMAGKLHLTNTHFVNPIGFDDPEQYTSARDLARLALYASKNETIVKIVGVPQITVSDTSFYHFHPLKNVNELLGKIPGVSGFKTGYTEAAGQSVVTTVQRNGRKVLIVVLGSKDRFGETENLLNWVFANHTWQELTPPS